MKKLLGVGLVLVVVLGLAIGESLARGGGGDAAVAVAASRVCEASPSGSQYGYNAAVGSHAAT